MWVLCLVLVFYAVLSFISRVCNNLGEEKIAGCFTSIVFLMCCDCKCLMALPRNTCTMGSSAVCCDCDIFSHTRGDPIMMASILFLLYYWP